MKKVLLALIVFMAFSSSAMAADYKLSATDSSGTYSDYWVTFANELWNDTPPGFDVILGIEETTGFSGLTVVASGITYSQLGMIPSAIFVNILLDGAGLVVRDGMDFIPISGGAWAYSLDEIGPAATPIPGAIWLLGSGIVGLVGVRRKMKA